MRQPLIGRRGVLALVSSLISVGAFVFATGRQPEPSAAINLIEDPGFESGVSGFTAQDSSSSVTQSADSPLQGGYSLRVSIAGYGNNIWWVRDFTGGLASRFQVSAHLRSDVQSSSTLRFCAMAYYADDSTAISCSPVSGARGDKGAVTAALVLDPARRLESVRLRLVQEGSAAVTFTLDDAVANLTVIEAPPPGGGGSGGGGGGGGGGGAGAATTLRSAPHRRHPVTPVFPTTCPPRDRSFRSSTTPRGNRTRTRIRASSRRWMRQWPGTRRTRTRRRTR